MKRNGLHDQLFADPAGSGTGVWAPWRRYTIVLLLVACAAAARLSLLPQEPLYGYLLFYLAVIAAGLLAGTGPIVFAAVLSLCAGDYFFAAPHAWFDSDRVLPAVLFILYCIVVYVLRRRTMDDRAQAHSSRRLLQSIFESNPDALLILDAERTIVMANRQAAVLLGHEQSELNGRRFESLVPDRLRANHALSQAALRRQAGARAAQPQESLILRKDGQEIEVEINVKPMRADHGPLIACTMRDIRARNRAEAELRISATAFESNDGIVVTDDRGVIQRINQAFTRISGYGMADLVGRSTDLLRSSRHDQEFYRAILDAIRESGGWQGEVWARRRNDEEYPVWLNISVVRDKDGRITHYVGSHSDITERKQAEEALLKAGALQRAIFNSANFSSIATDAKGVIQIFNVGAERMLG